MLNIISSVTCISFIIIDIHTIVSLHTVSRIYGSYTRSYISMRKKCLMFMLLLAASEHASEKNALKIKFSKRYCRVVQTYCVGRAPTNVAEQERSSYTHTLVIRRMTDVLQHGNWSGLDPNNRFVRLDNIFSKILFSMHSSQRAQMNKLRNSTHDTFAAFACSSSRQLKGRPRRNEATGIFQECIS